MKTGPREPAVLWGLPSSFRLLLRIPVLPVAKDRLVSTSPDPSLSHLRMSMKEGVWVTLAMAAPRLTRSMKGSTRWLQAESQEPAGTGPPPATQLQLV